MRNETWLEQLAHGLEAAGVGPADRAAAIVETDGFLHEAGVSALEHFGPPRQYAAELAAALRTSPEGRVRGPDDDARSVVVRVAGVTKRFRRSTVLDDISLTVEGGEVVVLTGANGAGKSTLLRIIAGLDRPDRGDVSVHGRVGYVPQAGGIDPYLRPADHFALFGAKAGLSRVDARREGERLARELGWDAREAPRAGELSGGTHQKLAVVSAMLGRPDVLLLDEPCTGMDASSRQRFWEALWAWQEAGRSALVSTHAEDAIAAASRVVEIEGLAAA